MAANIFISATTGLPEGCTPMTQLPLSHSITITTLIDSQHAPPCLQLSITDGLAILCQGEGSRPHSPLALVDCPCLNLDCQQIADQFLVPGLTLAAIVTSQSFSDLDVVGGLVRVWILYMLLCANFSPCQI